MDTCRARFATKLAEAYGCYQRIARALELPESAALDDVRQMVDGRLTERGEEPKSVQVALIHTDGGVVIELRNEDGTFLEVEPDPDTDTEIAERTGSKGARGSTPPPRLTDSTDARESEYREDSRVAEFEREVKRLTEENTALQEEVSELRDGVRVAKQKYRELWRLNCEQLGEYDSLVAMKEEEIEDLKKRVAEFEALGLGRERRASVQAPPNSGTACSTTTHVVADTGVRTASRVTHSVSEPHPISRTGKAPPIDPFDGETNGVTFEDWLPTLQRAAAWNGWTDDDSLVQLAGYLRKRALQEWNLLTDEERKTFSSATTALHNRLDPNNRVLAAQDFRHALQRDTETVAEYIRRLEQTYRTAYGRDGMSSQTRDTLLYSQLQEGLTYDLMRALAVSGAQGYQQLCIAARNEERRLIELEKRRRYTGPQPVVMSASMQPSTSTQLTSAPLQSSAQTVNSPLNVRAKSFTPKGQPGGGRGVRCYNCRQQGHYARDCLAPKRESSGPGSGGNDQDASARQVYSQEDGTLRLTKSVAARDVLYSSDSDGGEIQTVRVEDRGSKPRHVSVQVEGVPAEGVIDTGADITIIGGDLFRRVAAVARLKKKNLKEADKIPRTYDQRPFSLDGKIDMNITFDGMTMRTPVYVKLDAPEQLLLSEGVCRQLRIITYHPEVLIKKQSSGTQANGGQTQSREVPRKGEPELRMETVRQQRDAPSLTPNIRKDQNMDVVQLNVELPSSDRKVKPADRGGDCQSDSRPRTNREETVRRA